MDVSRFTCARVAYDDPPGILRELCGDEQVISGLPHDMDSHQEGEHTDERDEGEEDVDNKQPEGYEDACYQDDLLILFHTNRIGSPEVIRVGF